MIFSMMVNVEQPAVAGSYGTDGLYVMPSSTTVPMRGNIQPMGDSEILLMPEGDRLKECIVVYSDQKLYAEMETNQRPADVVQYNGNRYKVVKVKDYSQVPIGLKHYRSQAVIIYSAEA